MKKIMILLLIGLLTASMILGCSQTKAMNALSDTHIGGAILREPVREASEDIYSVKHESLAGYGDFDRKVTVYGLTLLVHKDISDDFVNKITETMQSMFPNNVDNPALQEEVLQNMYKYKATLPVVKREKDIAGVQTSMMKDFSVCDIIMKVENNQVNEVVEHLLHAITDVGLHYTFNEAWGVNQSSQVYTMMQDAIKNKHYDIKDYEGYPEDILNRVLIQEYAYWSIVSLWNFEPSTQLGGSEWTLTSYDNINESLPELVKLYDATVHTIMQVPSQETLAY